MTSSVKHGLTLALASNMPVPDSYVVEVKGPNGVKQIELPGDQVRFFSREHGSDYAAALFLASCDLAYQERETQVDNITKT